MTTITSQEPQIKSSLLDLLKKVKHPNSPFEPQSFKIETLSKDESLYRISLTLKEYYPEYRISMDKRLHTDILNWAVNSLPFSSAFLPYIEEVINFSTSNYYQIEIFFEV